MKKYRYKGVTQRRSHEIPKPVTYWLVRSRAVIIDGYTIKNKITSIGRFQKKALI